MDSAARHFTKKEHVAMCRVMALLRPVAPQPDAGAGPARRADQAGNAPVFRYVQARVTTLELLRTVRLTGFHREDAGQFYEVFAVVMATKPNRSAKNAGPGAAADG